MSKLISIKKVLDEISKERQLSLLHAGKFLEHRVRCGKLLLGLKNSVGEGQWEKTLAEINFPKATAWRYIRTFQDWDPKTKRLKRGAALVDGLRSDNLIDEVEGGGYRSEAYQRRKLGTQLELDFEYEEFDQHITALIDAKNVEELSPKTLAQALAKLEQGAARVRSVLADKNALPVEVASDDSLFLPVSGRSTP